MVQIQEQRFIVAWPTAPASRLQPRLRRNSLAQLGTLPYQRSGSTLHTTRNNLRGLAAHIRTSEIAGWLFCGECDRQDWRGVAMLSAAVKPEVRTFPKGYQLVPRRPREGGHSRRHASYPEGPEREDILVATPTGLQGTHSDDRAGRRQRQ
jgi:hypothetical protein